MAKSWMVRYMEPLVGGKITKVGETEPDALGDSFPYFEIDTRKYGKLTIEISQDGEGSGPGFLFGLPQIK